MLQVKLEFVFLTLERSQLPFKQLLASCLVLVQFNNVEVYFLSNRKALVADPYSFNSNATKQIFIAVIIGDSSLFPHCAADFLLHSTWTSG